MWEPTEGFHVLLQRLDGIISGTIPEPDSDEGWREIMRETFRVVRAADAARKASQEETHRWVADHFSPRAARLSCWMRSARRPRSRAPLVNIA